MKSHTMILIPFLDNFELLNSLINNEKNVTLLYLRPVHSYEIIISFIFLHFGF